MDDELQNVFAQFEADHRATMTAGDPEAVRRTVRARRKRRTQVAGVLSLVVLATSGFAYTQHSTGPGPGNADQRPSTSTEPMQPIPGLPSPGQTYSQAQPATGSPTPGTSPSAQPGASRTPGGPGGGAVVPGGGTSTGRPAGSAPATSTGGTAPEPAPSDSTGPRQNLTVDFRVSGPSTVNFVHSGGKYRGTFDLALHNAGPDVSRYESWYINLPKGFDIDFMASPAPGFGMCTQRTQNPDGSVLLGCSDSGSGSPVAVGATRTHRITVVASVAPTGAQQTIEGFGIQVRPYGAGVADVTDPNTGNNYAGMTCVLPPS
ncbi:hypothetical protein [Longispora albida]|uniref:hypothetical protein n=1 Tax=Longispora albida TaxID=203523 RepID=UPI0003A3F87C|nr:hypothetical protein [Longispora albida]